MAFSAKQVRSLRRQPDHRFIRTREANGRELTYLEGWYAISEANRIFGFDGWSRETIESRCVLARENRGTFLAVYLARVRVTVHADELRILHLKLLGTPRQRKSRRHIVGAFLLKLDSHFIVVPPTCTDTILGLPFWDRQFEVIRDKPTVMNNESRSRS
jgi:hypothetical protein